MEIKNIVDYKKRDFERMCKISLCFPRQLNWENILDLTIALLTECPTNLSNILFETKNDMFYLSEKINEQNINSKIKEITNEEDGGKISLYYENENLKSNIIIALYNKEDFFDIALKLEKVEKENKEEITLWVEDIVKRILNIIANKTKTNKKNIENISKLIHLENYGLETSDNEIDFHSFSDDSSTIQIEFLDSSMNILEIDY
jgi:hypothetical protein